MREFKPSPGLSGGTRLGKILGKIIDKVLGRASALAIGRSGTAAMEMGIVAPLLVALSAAISDFSLVYHKQLQLSSTLASAAEYAMNKGQSETGSTLTTDVTTFVNTITPAALSALQVNYYGGTTATSYYCVSTTGAFTANYTKGEACTDGSGSVAGQFITISASFAYSAVFPVDKAWLPKTYTQSVIVRLA
jgi:Flp pilus assembly protein TadG